MKTTGRVLTTNERSRVERHFLKNDGIKWNLAKIKEYVEKGATAIEADQNTKEAVEAGIMKAAKE